MLIRRSVALVSVLFVTALGIAACGDEGDGGGSAESLELTIGHLVPQSGELASFGPSLSKAGQLSVDQINAAVDDAGLDHEVSIEVADTQSVPASAVQAARTLVNDGASCLVGPLSSAATLPVARSVATREDVTLIGYAGTADEISDVEDEGLVNRTVIPNALQGAVLAGLVDRAMGGAEGKLVNVGARNDAGNQTFADGFINAWEPKGGTVGENIALQPGQPTYDSEAQQLVAGDPDAFVIAEFLDTYNKLGPALVRTGDWDASRTFVADTFASSSLPDTLPPAAVEGLRGVVPGAANSPAAQAFLELYENAPGPKLETYNVQDVDAVVLCYLAAVAAGDSDGAAIAGELQAVSAPPGNEYTVEQLPAAVEALQNGEDIDYQGVSGPIDLDDKGDPTSAVYDVFTFKNDSLKIVDQVEFTGE